MNVQIISSDTPIKYTNEASAAPMQGVAPIVIIGPNGAGKSRHAVQMSQWNDADMIAALRNIALPPDVVMHSMEQAKQGLTQHLNRRRSTPWEMSNEINELFSKLMAEDSAAAIRFRDEHAENKTADPEITKLMQLQHVWTRLFPGRHINFTGYRPRVLSDYSTTSGEYLAQQMSDGERVALYLAGRIIDSDKKIIIVDEPEVHFHSRLATRFWSEMETIRKDCRFVYVTHDLPFALSRKDATFLVIMPNSAPRIVSLVNELSKEVAESLLAAASFSIHARRIIFCEGTEGGSLDKRFYESWFPGSDTAVIPVESCENVINCTKVFGESSLVAGVEALGIIDRDYWPNEFLEALHAQVKPLMVHEVDNLFCVAGVFIAIAEHLKKNNPTKLYESFLSEARLKFVGGLLNKQISERFRRRCEHQFRKKLNKLPLSENLEDMKKSHAEEISSEKWDASPVIIMNEETNRIQSALQTEGFLKYFPGKVFLNLASNALGIDTETYVDLICKALNADNTEPVHAVGVKIEQALLTHLPSRKIDGSLEPHKST